MTESTGRTRKARSDKGVGRKAVSPANVTATRRTTGTTRATESRVRIATSEIDVIDELAKIMDQLERRDNATKWYIEHKYVRCTFDPKPAEHAAKAAQDSYKLIVQSMMLIARLTVPPSRQSMVLAEVTSRMAKLRADRIVAGAEDGM